MTLYTVPPGTLTNCDYLVTGLKVTEHMLTNSLAVPDWVKNMVPKYIPPWERPWGMHKSRPEAKSRRRVFGCREEPLTLSSAEMLPLALARAGFTPNRCSVKRVSSNGKPHQYVAVSIFWSRPGTDDSPERARLVQECQTFFQQIQRQYAWAVYAKEMIDHDDTHIVAVNFSAPQLIVPSRRDYEITLDANNLVYRPHPARTLFD